MSPRFQVKLLRVLEDGCFEAVGSATSQRVDVRVLAATHRDLRGRARDGLFRSDLLYRLDVIPSSFPLSATGERTSPCSRGISSAASPPKAFPAFELAPETGNALMDYDWPGNVRELRNVWSVAVLLSDGAGVLMPADLPPPLGGLASRAHRTSPHVPTTERWTMAMELSARRATDFYLELDGFERRMIGRALELARGSKREAARLLLVNRPRCSKS
jgi:DNA-binding NtrC family response regulator